MKSIPPSKKCWFFLLTLSLLTWIYASQGYAQEVIVDNSKSGTSFTGTWSASSSTGYYGSNSLWSRSGATYTWHANLPETGTYAVYMWWTQYPSRSTNAPVTITHSGGSQTVYVNQQTNGGKWNLLGTYSFNTSSGGSVQLRAVNGSPTSYCADAVRFVRVSATNVIIDNGQAGTSFTGTWNASSSTGYYGTNSLWSRDGATYTWHANLSQSASYDVYMWWTQYDSRSTSAPVTITHDSGSQTVNVNQRINGGKWNYLGTFNFNSSSGGTVRIQAPNGAPTSYCADAVRFTRSTGNIPPTAAITSISPNPAAVGAIVTLTGSGNDVDGTITGYGWRSSIDGTLGTSASIQKNNLTQGQHSIYFSVRDDKGLWSDEVSKSLSIGSNSAEHIYYAPGYGETNTEPVAFQMLSNLGAVRGSSYWTYKNTAQNKTYYIHFIHDNNALKQAMMTSGAHIIYSGHANYGLGGLFDTETEHNNQSIDNIRYIDDDRFFNYSSKWISVGLYGIRTSQAFPYFWPIFKDGTSGIMPYKFGDPRGNPPYNYYLTYRVPGNSTYYKVETVRNSGIERFFSSDIPAWYSSSGATPSPSNSSHTQYFMTNTTPWSPSIQAVGSWGATKLRLGFYNENYQQASAGTGEKQFKWLFTIPTAGNYKIYAWWAAHSDRATAAPYTITHSGGSTRVNVNQQVNGNRWNELGQHYFNKGNYSVTLTNAVSSGYVVADAVRVSHVNNPPEVIQSDFRGSPLYGTDPLSVRFINQGVAYTNRHWDFGDGLGNSTRDDVTHTYTTPGIYTVSLQVSSSLGTNTRTKSSYVHVGDGVTQTRAEFRASPQVANIPATISFRDASSGNVVSWLWDFGDGTTSSSERPTHVYSGTGNFTVKLTVKDSAGKTSTETKTNFIRAVVYEKNIDNVDYPLNHYGSRTILFRNAPEVLESDLKYSRMFYCACNSGNYFIDTFHRGIMFYTLNTPDDRDGVYYLEAYLKGKSDYQIWQTLQSKRPVFDYYNFNKLPTDQ